MDVSVSTKSCYNLHSVTWEKFVDDSHLASSVYRARFYTVYITIRAVEDFPTVSFTFKFSELATSYTDSDLH